MKNNASPASTKPERAKKKTPKKTNGTGTVTTLTASKKKRGRPTKYTEAVIEEICARLSDGEPLAQICREERMPEVATIYLWREKDLEINQRIARAREAGFDAIANDCLEIVDDRKDDPDSSSRRVRAEIRLKLLAKWDPKRYGDRIDQNITVETGPKTLDAIRERAKMLASPFDRRAAVVDVPEADADSDSY